MSDTAFLLDASIPIFRYYFSLPENWVSRDGIGTAAVYGYTHWLRRLLLAEQPVFIAACFDESLGSGFRHQLDPAYKSSRALPDEALAYQLHACRRITEFMGVPTYGSNSHEADDLIGSLAALHRSQGRRCLLISRDKDLGQLLEGGDQFWDYPDQAPLDVAGFTARWGVSPAQMADYLALVGDKSDDIPGVPGIGPKTACALLAHFGSIQSLLENLHQVAALPVRGAARIAGQLAAHVQRIQLNRQLASICCDVPLESPARLTRQPVDWPQLLEYAEHLGFRLRQDPDL
jgi:5''-3'' exonuclease (including N-terminal domain of PolI)